MPNRNFLSISVLDEHRLATPLDDLKLALLNARDVDLDGGQREHIS